MSFEAPQAKQPDSPDVITHVPSVEELEATPAVQPEVDMPDTPLLDGPRGTGSYQLPNGNTVVAEVTPDGMKQTRVVGPERPKKDPREAYDAYLRIGQPEVPVTAKKGGKFITKLLLRKK